MKKLMIAAYAVVAATVGMAVESSNVVGYQNKELDLGQNSYVIQTLCPVGKDVADSGTVVTLADIKPTDDWDESSDTLYKINELGLNIGNYTYVSEANLKYYPGADAAGWYDAVEIQEDGEVSSGRYDDVELPMNSGFCVYNNTGAQLTFAGEVLKGDCELFTDTGKNAYTGNASPVDIDISDLVPSEDWDESSDTLYIINELGLNIADYTYVSAANLKYYDGATVPGWYNAVEIQEDGEVSTGCYNGLVEIKSGQGFCVYQNTDATISVPSALP